MYIKQQIMKAATEIQKQMDNLELFRKRIEILSEARLREIDGITSAIKVQDSIRAKVSKWNGAREIKKWRDAR